MASIDWLEAIGFTATGFISGGIFSYYALRDKVELHVTKTMMEEATNKKRIQLDRNNRTNPRRSDATEGSSRIHRVKIRRK